MSTWSRPCRCRARGATTSHRMARVEMGCRRGRDSVFPRWSSNGASFCGARVPESFFDVFLTRRVASHAHPRGCGRGALGRVKTIFAPIPLLSARPWVRRYHHTTVLGVGKVTSYVSRRCHQSVRPDPKTDRDSPLQSSGARSPKMSFCRCSPVSGAVDTGDTTIRPSLGW